MDGWALSGRAFVNMAGVGNLASLPLLMVHVQSVYLFDGNMVSDQEPAFIDRDPRTQGKGYLGQPRVQCVVAFEEGHLSQTGNLAFFGVLGGVVAVPRVQHRAVLGHVDAELVFILGKLHVAPR